MEDSAFLALIGINKFRVFSRLILFDPHCAKILIEAVQLGRAGYGDDPRLLCEQPGERNPRGRRAFCRRNLFK